MIITNGAQDRSAAAMPRVEHTTKLYVVAQKGIGFIDQETGAVSLDNAKDRGCADVGGRQRAMHQPGQDIQQCRLSASLDGRADSEAWGDHEDVKQTGVHGPQRGEVETVLCHNHVPLDHFAERIEQRDAINRFRPGLRLGKRDGMALLAVIAVEAKLGTLCLDRPIEDGGADPEFVGGRLAGPLVFERWKLGEAFDLGVIIVAAVIFLPLLLCVLDLTAGIVFGAGLIQAVRRDAILGIEDCCNDRLRIVAALEQLENHVPNRARTIAAEVAAAAVFDQRGEIVFLLAISGRFI
jgi:hypothetical protein